MKSFSVFKAQMRKQNTGTRGTFSRKIFQSFKMDFILENEDKVRIVENYRKVQKFSKKLEQVELIHLYRKKESFRKTEKP